MPANNWICNLGQTNCNPRGLYSEDIRHYYSAYTNSQGYFTITVPHEINQPNIYLTVEEDYISSHGHTGQAVHDKLYASFSLNNLNVTDETGVSKLSLTGPMNDLLIIVEPKNYYYSQIEIPLNFMQTQVSFGYKELNLYVKNYTEGAYTITGQTPTLSLVAGTPGYVNLSFGISVKYNNSNIGSASVLFSVSPQVLNHQGGLSLAIKCSTENELTLTNVSGTLGSHLNEVKTKLKNKLSQPIYLVPVSFIGTLVSIPSINTNIWNSSMCSGITFSTNPAGITINIRNGWYIY